MSEHPPALPHPEHPHLASAVPGSVPLFDLLLLLLPLLLGGGLREVLGLAELLGGLCHGAAVTATAAAPAPSTSCPCLLFLSPKPPSLHCPLFLLSGGHAMCVTGTSLWLHDSLQLPQGGRCYSEWCWCCSSSSRLHRAASPPPSLPPSLPALLSPSACRDQSRSFVSSPVGILLHALQNKPVQIYLIIPGETILRNNSNLPKCIR